MKTWMVWVLLIIGVASIALFAYWLTSTLPTLTCSYICTTLNLIVSIYLIVAFKNK